MAFPVFVFALLFATTRIVSLASIGAALATPTSMVLVGAGTANVAVAVFLAGLVTVRHRENIHRLRKGEEPRFGRR